MIMIYFLIFFAKFSINLLFIHFKHDYWVLLINLKLSFNWSFAFMSYLALFTNPFLSFIKYSWLLIWQHFLPYFLHYKWRNDIAWGQRFLFSNKIITLHEFSPSYFEVCFISTSLLNTEEIYTIFYLVFYK